MGQGFSVHCVKLCVAAIVCAGSRWLWTQDPSASLALSCSYLCRVLRVSLCIGVCCLFHTLALSRSATCRSVQKTCLSRLPCSISWCLLCLCRRSTCCEEAGASSISTLWCCFSQAALRGLFRRRTRSLFFFLLFFPANFAHFSRSSSLLLCPRLSLYCRVLLSWLFGYLYLSTPCQERNKLLHALLGKLLHALLGTLLAAAVASASLTLRGLWNRHQKSLHVF